MANKNRNQKVQKGRTMQPESQQVLQCTLIKSYQTEPAPEFISHIFQHLKNDSTIPKTNTAKSKINSKHDSNFLHHENMHAGFSCAPLFTLDSRGKKKKSKDTVKPKN